MSNPTSNPADAIDPLTRLAIHHGTDKWGLHFYTPIYHTLFAPLRDRPLRLLEIGIGGYQHITLGGASLAMWADYFPNGTIVGIDSTEKRLEFGPRVHLRQGSQDDAAFLKQVSQQLGPFDIIIDDGCHVPGLVIASFNVLFPLLRDGGLYVIEDVQTSFWPEFGGSTEDGGPTMRLAKAALDQLNHAEIKIVAPEHAVADVFKSIRSLRAYHNMLVFEKGDNTEPSNFRYDRDNTHAAHALRTIELELARSPTAAGYANLIDVHAKTGDLAKAQAMADQALTRWPDHPGLLFVAHDIAAEGKDRTRKLEHFRKLAAREPDNPALQAKLRDYEGAAKRKRWWSWLHGVRSGRP